MKLYSGPVTLPGPLRFGTEADREISRSLLWFCRRSKNLLRAAGLIDGCDEPGLLLPEDRVTARKLGGEFGASLPETGRSGHLEIGFLRSLTGDGIAVQRLPYKNLVTLQDECGLAGAFLEALALCALENGHRVLLCPALLRPERPEAVILPELGAAWASERTGIHGAMRIGLDEIPEAERKSALEAYMVRDHGLQQMLLEQAMEQMKLAGILYSLFE